MSRAALSTGSRSAAAGSRGGPTGRATPAPDLLGDGADARRSSIAVIIPCFNQGAFLAEALDSVAAQSQPVDQIIVVNDGSTDAETHVTLDEVAKRPGVEILHQSNAGLAAARNAGVRASETDLFIPLDADDRLTPDFVARTHAARIANPDAAYVYTDVRFFGARAGLWRCPEFDAAHLVLENLSVATALIDRAAYDASGGYRPAMSEGYEDWDLWLTFAQHGRRGLRVPEPLFEYRQHAGGSMLTKLRARDDRMLREMVRAHHGFVTQQLRLPADASLEVVLSERAAALHVRRLRTARLFRGLTYFTREAALRAAPLDPPLAPSDDLDRVERSWAQRCSSALKRNPLHALWRSVRYRNER